MEILIYVMIAVLLFMIYGFATAPAVDEDENLISPEALEKDKLDSGYERISVGSNFGANRAA